MKGKNPHKKINVLALLIILVALTLITLFIVANSSAKYVITDNFSINLSNYYMVVTPPVVTEFEDTPITTSFTVNNNNGIDYMTEDLVYTISVQESNIWNISAVGGLVRTISGGSIAYDMPSITLTPKSGATMNWSETITILLTVTAPYPDQKEIELTYIGGPAPTLTLSTTNTTFTASQLNVTSGTITSSHVTINPNSTQYGPYLPYGKGTYHVTITGTNLSNVNVDAVGDYGGTVFSVYGVVKTPTQITYTLYIPNDNPVVEFRAFTDSSTTATVSQIELVAAVGNNGWYSNDAIATINKNTTEINVQPQYQLVTNGIAGQWTNYTGPFLIGAEGTTTINIKNVNTSPSGGEKLGEPTTIKIDKTPPDNFGISKTSTTKTTITTNGATGDQGGSGLNTYYYSINDGVTWLGPNPSGNYTFTGLIANTTYNIKQKAIDNAGNETISNTLTATTLPTHRVETIIVTRVLADCGQYQQSSSGSGTNNGSSGIVSASEVKAESGTSSMFEERTWTTVAGYQGNTLKTIAEDEVNSNFSGWTSYTVTAKLNLEINIDFGNNNTQGDANCETWTAGQSTKTKLKTWSGGSSANNGNHNVANLYNIYSWSNGQTPADFYISIYVRKAGSWTTSRKIRYYPQSNKSFVTFEINVTIPNPD